MASIDAVIRPRARRFLEEEATPEEERDILARIEMVCERPGLDDVTVFPFGGEGERIFSDGRY